MQRWGSSQPLSSISFELAYPTDTRGSGNMALPSAAICNNEFFYWQMERVKVEQSKHPNKQWQETFPKLASLPEFQTLRAHLNSLVRAYCLNFVRSNTTNATSVVAPPINVMDDECSSPSLSDKQMYYWLAIHRRTSYHLPHVHKESLINGVYYIQVPPYCEESTPNSGRIAFQDPRGVNPYYPNLPPIPPFEKEFLGGSESWGCDFISWMVTSSS